MTFTGLIDLLVDDVLLVGNVMQSWAGELEVIELFTELTRLNLEFIRDISTFVAEEAEELIIHVTFPENFDEFFIFHRK